MDILPPNGDLDVRPACSNNQSTQSIDNQTSSTNGSLCHQLSHISDHASNSSHRSPSIVKPCLVHRPASSGDGDADTYLGDRQHTTKSPDNPTAFPELQFSSRFGLRRHSEMSDAGAIDMLQLSRQQKRYSQSRSPPPALALLSATSDSTSTSKDTTSNRDPLHTPRLAAGDRNIHVENEPMSLIPSAAIIAATQSNSIDCPADGGPLVQAVVVALCEQHRLHYRGSMIGGATTSTASSSRFSPPSFSSADDDDDDDDDDDAVEHEDYDNLRTECSRKPGGIIYKSSCSSRTPSCGMLQYLDEVNTERATAKTTTHEGDAESGYGASCSSSSAPLLRCGSVSAKRDKRRCRRRTAQRRGGLHTAESNVSHSGDDFEFSGRCASQNDGDCDCSSLPLAVSALPETEANVELRSATSPRAAGQTGRHKRNRVRILDGRTPTPPSAQMISHLSHHRSSCPEQRYVHSHFGDHFPIQMPTVETTGATSAQRIHDQTGLSYFSLSDNELFRNRICGAHGAQLLNQRLYGYAASSVPHDYGSPSTFSTSVTPSGFETSSTLASILVSDGHSTSTQAYSHPRTVMGPPQLSSCNHSRCSHWDTSLVSRTQESSVVHRPSPRNGGTTVLSCLTSNDRPSCDTLEEDQRFSELLSTPPPPLGDDILPTTSTAIPPDRITLSSSDCSAPSCCCSLRDSLSRPKSDDVSRNTSPSPSSTRAAWHADIPMHCRLVAGGGGVLSYRDSFLPTAVTDAKGESERSENSPISSRSIIERRRFSAPVHERQQIPRTSEEQEPMYEVNLTMTNSCPPTASPHVSLVVDNVRFIVDPQLIQAHPETMLGRMLSSQFPEAAQVCHHRQQHRHSPQQDIHVARNSTISAQLFRAILDYYLIGQISCPPGVTAQVLKEACDYFLIPFSQHTVRCSNLRAFLHELSNDGAHNLFQQFLESHILALLVRCARQGERECHLVIVTDDETIDWDAEYPPQMPGNELNAHIIYNTQMFRFLKYIENRDVAKQVLSERGLKKIRIGIEGYPTSKDRVKFRPGIRPEAIYNYVQCPSLRMSWEEEENKSRHVDFQCVKSRSVSDLTTGLEQAVIDPLPPHFSAVEAMGTDRRSPGRQSPPLVLSFDPAVDENTATMPDQPMELQTVCEAIRVVGMNPAPQVDTVRLAEDQQNHEQYETASSRPYPAVIGSVPNNAGEDVSSELEPVN